MSKFDSIRVISFDLDDTLWPTMQTIVEAERQLFCWLEEHTPELARQHSIESLRAHRRELALANPEIAHDMNQTRLLHLRELFAGLGYDTALAEVAVRHFQQHRNRVFPYEDVRPVLERLREEFILVSVTNGTSEVEKTPLAGIFHHSFNAVDAGRAKPHPAIFELVIDRTGAVPHEVLHVGDDPARDIVPARELGLVTAWINRHGQQWPDTLEAADHRMETLDEMPV
ncbi:MAG: HAD family hydrolase [Gammaproteobacteria bacterium]